MEASLLLWILQDCDSLTATQVSTGPSEKGILQQHTMPSSHVCNFEVQRRSGRGEGWKQMPVEGDEVAVHRDRKKQTPWVDTGVFS